MSGSLLDFKWPAPPEEQLAVGWLQRKALAFSSQLEKVKTFKEVGDFLWRVYDFCEKSMNKADDASLKTLLELRRVHRASLCSWLVENFELASRVLDKDGGLSLAGCGFASLLAIEYCHFRRTNSGHSLWADGDDGDSWEVIGKELASMDHHVKDRFLMPFLSEQDSIERVDHWTTFSQRLLRLACKAIFGGQPREPAEVFTFTEHVCRLWCCMQSALSVTERKVHRFAADQQSKKLLSRYLDEYMELIPDEKMAKEYTELVYAHILGVGARERFLAARGGLAEITRSGPIPKDEQRLLSIIRETLTEEQIQTLVEEVATARPNEMYRDAKHKFLPLLRLKIVSDSIRDASGSKFSVIEKCYIAPVHWWTRCTWFTTDAGAGLPFIAGVADRLVVALRDGSRKMWFAETMDDAIILLCALAARDVPEIKSIAKKIVSPALLARVMKWTS